MDARVRLCHCCDEVNAHNSISGLNLLLILTPVAWWSHFDGRLNYNVDFARTFGA